MTRTIVFLGPSLPVAEAARVLPYAEWRPPAQKGDFYALLDEPEPVGTIVLIDGIFHGAPSVWPREIVAALDAGVVVHGASSMGALRAAECAAFGMRGHGAIFGWYVDGTIDGDDEVALRHGDGETGWRALSEPLVNIRATLAAARAAGVLDDAEADRLTAEAKATFYPERDLRRLSASPAAAARLRAHRIDQKRADALTALAAVAAGLTSTSHAPAVPARRHAWSHERLRSELGRVAGPDGRLVPGATALAALRARRDLVAELRPELVTRWFVLDVEQRAGFATDDDHAAACAAAETALRAGPPPAGLTGPRLAEAHRERALATRLRARLGDATLLAAWADAAGVHAPAGEPLAAWLVARGPTHFGHGLDLPLLVLRELLVTGRLARLWEPAP